MRSRRNKLIRNALILLGIGALYAVFVSVTGFAVPCVFHLATGLLCPGCGVTRMFLCIFRFDFAGAFHANAALFCLLPLMAATAARLAYLYVRRGSSRDRLSQAAVWAMIAVLLAWGIVRNVI